MSAYQFPAAAPSGPTTPSADPTAVIGRRVGGWVVDFLLYTLIMAFVAPTPLSPLAEYYDDVPNSVDACEVLQEDGDAVGCLAFGDRVYVTDGPDTAVQFVVFILVVLLYSALQGARGITPGKAIFRIKVVDEQGDHPGFGKSLARTLLWIVDLAPWCLPLVGFITGLSTKGHRRVGDMAAKTFVVGKGHTGPVAVPGMATAATGGYPGGYPGAPGQPWGTPPGGAPGAPPPAWGGPPTAQQPGAWGAPPPGPQGPGGPPAGPAPAPDQRPAPPTGWTPPGTESPSASGGASDATPGPPAAAPSGARTEPPPTVEDPGTDAAPPSSSGSPRDEGGSGEATSTAPDDPASTPASPAAPPPAEDSAPDDSPSARSPAPDAGAQAPATPSGSAPAGSSGGGGAAPSGYNPQWDAARGTYIVWEPNRGMWLGWDEAASEWKPL